MKTITWDNSLSVGVDEIDEDHHRLVNLFNMLIRAVSERYTQDYIAALLDELVSCTVWHFKHEERLMLKYNYEGLSSHKTEHMELIESAEELQIKFYRVGKNISSEDVEILERWLMGHILGADMEMGSYLGENM